MLNILVATIHNEVARSFYSYVPGLDKRRPSPRNAVPVRVSIFHTYEILTSEHFSRQRRYCLLSYDFHAVMLLPVLLEFLETQPSASRSTCPHLHLSRCS